MSTQRVSRPEKEFIRAHSEGPCSGERLFANWRDVDREDNTAERGALCADCGAESWWGERRPL